MYRRILIVTFAIIGLCTVLTILPIHSEGQIYDSVLRLHVLANSDSEDDQALKLRVRDAILQDTAHLFENCKTRDEAGAAVIENLPLFQRSAERAICEEGYSYPVRIELGKEEYPTRNYESACFPAGEYLSLRVLIGEGEGQNWWCVLFPPLCVSAASESDGSVEVGLYGDQYAIVTETEDIKYKIRFKLLEAIEKAVN
jgi:stage II sporulation protein R